MQNPQIAAQLAQAHAAYVAGMREVTQAKTALEKPRQDAVQAAIDAGMDLPQIRRAMESDGLKVSRETVRAILASLQKRRTEGTKS